MIYRLIAILALAALLIGVVVLSGGERQGAAPATVEAPSDPGYSARKARLIQTGADGQPLYTLDAEEVRQQPQTNVIDMQTVALGFRDASGDEWTAHGNHGELAQNSGIVKLDGAVSVLGTLPGTQEPAQFLTEHLAFDTNTQVIATLDPVTLVMTGRRLEAQGMVANLKEHRVQLQSAVHGTYGR